MQGQNKTSFIFNLRLIKIYIVYSFKNFIADMSKQKMQKSFSELPFSDYPTKEEPRFFYKIRNRISQKRQNVIIGLKIHQMKKFQQDYLLHLMQVFHCNYTRIKLKLVERTFLYGQILIDIFDESQDDEYLSIQSKLFRLLQELQIHLSHFIKTVLNQQYLFSEHFQEQQLAKKFKEDVIYSLKKIENNIFLKKREN